MWVLSMETPSCLTVPPTNSLCVALIVNLPLALIVKLTQSRFISPFVLSLIFVALSFVLISNSEVEMDGILFARLTNIGTNKASLKECFRVSSGSAISLFTIHLSSCLSLKISCPVSPASIGNEILYFLFAYNL